MSQTPTGLYSLPLAPESTKHLGLRPDTAQYRCAAIPGAPEGARRDY